LHQDVGGDDVDGVAGAGQQLPGEREGQGRRQAGGGGADSAGERA